MEIYCPHNDMESNYLQTTKQIPDKRIRQIPYYAVPITAYGVHLVFFTSNFAQRVVIVVRLL
jgi:hypothetical protein